MYPNMQDWVASCIWGIWTQRLTSGRDSTWLSLSPQPDSSSHHQMTPTTIKKRDVRSFPGNCGSRREEKMVVDPPFPPSPPLYGQAQPSRHLEPGRGTNSLNSRLIVGKMLLAQDPEWRGPNCFRNFTSAPTLQQKRLSIYFETPVFNVKTLDLQPAQYITSKHFLKQ